MIIGICGLIGSGKDTIADYLVSNCNYTRMSFATTLKDACADIFNWDRTMLEGLTPEARVQRESIDTWWADKLNIPNFSPRYALQYIGTDLFRNILSSDIWVHSIENKIKEFNNKKNIVISDVRFPNEISMIRNNFGRIWYIHRGVIPDWFKKTRKIHNTSINPVVDIRAAYPDLHESEWAWSGTDFDMTIDNNGSLQDLHNEVDRMINNFKYHTLNEHLLFT